jgi:putative tryptophan/tyrosine transport system substrate-binding protein
VPLQEAKIRRVGFAWIGSPEHESLSVSGLRQGLTERGYVLGRDLVFDERYAEGKPERIPALITELLAGGANVLVTPGNAAARAAHEATATVPIVYVGDDLVGAGLVASLARPGGNVTGVDIQSNDYRVKWVELLTAIAPNLRRLAVLWDPNENQAVLKMKEAEPRFGVALTFLSAQPEEMDESLAAVAAGRFDGLIVNDNTLLVPQVPRIVALVAESRTQTLYGWTVAAKLGGLMAYSTNFIEVGRLLADYVDKILKGAPPGDLPVQRPAEFDLAINLKTAKSLGLDIPPTVLAAADEVIE